MELRRITTWWLVGLCLAAPTIHATTLAQMNLTDLSSRAGRIFRGTVGAVDHGTVKAGGGELPTVTYRLNVTDTFKGSFVTRGNTRSVDVRMVGVPQGQRALGTVRPVSVLRALPSLAVGQEYLLFTTTPSRIGLSTTVGLGQGAFRIHGQGGAETAVNAFGNVGLFSRMTDAATLAAQPAAGSISYSDLAGRIRALVGR